ncbi:MAG: sigma-70 family RNA polymerase sigma factor [Ruminococcus sp.]|nr:sigma-70 family RNA polymerase sigma factor [Ruminococcus sp.]
MRRVSYTEIFDPSMPEEHEKGHDLLKAKLVKAVLDDNLTKKQKYYIILYYRDKLRVSEIARRCGVNRSTVLRTLRRGQQRLAELSKRSEPLNRLKQLEEAERDG